MPSEAPVEVCCALVDLELPKAERRVQRHPPLYWTAGAYWRAMLERSAKYRRGPIDFVSKDEIAAGTLRAEARASTE